MMRMRSAIGSQRARQADLASTVGAGVLGAGLSALLARYLDVEAFAAAVIVIGVVLHGWGMFERRRLEDHTTRRVWWSEALYWLCWAGLAAISAVLILRR